MVGYENSSARAFDQMDREAHLRKKHANMKCQRVKIDESLGPSLEDEAVEVQHLVAEPKTDHTSVDGVLCFGKENSWKRSEIEDFSYGFEFGLSRSFGGLDSNNAQGQDDLELGVLDGLLDEVDEVDDIHAANDISGACEDFLLDVELAEKISDPDFVPCERSQLRNSVSESQSPGFSGSSNGGLGLSESSTETIPDSECKNGSLERTFKREIHDSSGDKWDSQATAEDSILHSSHNLEDLDQLDNEAKLLSGLSSDENETKIVQSIKVTTVLRQKRLRKPTKRYIEEFSGPKSKLVEREKFFSAVSKDKRPKIRSHSELHCMRTLTYAPKEDSLSETSTQATPEEIQGLSDSKKHIIERQRAPAAASKGRRLKIRSRNEQRHVRAGKSDPKEGSFAGTTSQPAFESRPRRGRPKKCLPLSFLESDDEHTASEAEDECVQKRKSKKGADRRKHQRMWTPTEVMKLIDGIAEYGTGRWTDIKKLMFSSSAYRTPVDLRDKWRNLLRASCAQKQKQNKREVEQKLKHAMRPLPKSVLRRIRELAKLHPYPRFTPGGRYIRRKKN